ncbi:MAG: methylenetetrahydrofolate reductase [Alphaproteobacteria bacterium]|nr:methylenetetrahydrofolate reductase [Alphaproteobacteria bacterium]
MSSVPKTISAELPFPAGAPRDLKVSFEFFPPNTEKMAETLWSSIQRLEPLQPRFVSVTYGAGGSTRERTHATVVRILKETSLIPAAHLTCVNATKDEVDAVAREYWEAGVRNIVALRGDPPDAEAGYQPHPDGYAYAVDLVAGLKKIADFDISVAAYPEGHPQAESIDSDIENLKRKLDAGADRAITQYFFGAEPFLRFMDRVRGAGIDAPVVPGILPVQNFAQVVRFSKMSGTNVPDWMGELFDGLDDDPESRRLVAATVAAEQCRQLHAQGVTEFHFYTLNRADLTFAIAHILGLRPQNLSPEAKDASA